MTAVAGAPAPLSTPLTVPLSAVEVFRARQRARRPTVVIFYRGERSRFCRTWLRRWLSVPALERRLALADTALIFVSSQSQGKAYSVAAQSGVPDHLLDHSIIFLGDPQHALAAYLESVNLLAPVVTNPTGHRAHAWVYDYGMVQPAVVAVAPDSTVLFAWAMQPCFRNAGGKLERPDPWDAWDYIERKLDRFRVAALDARTSSSGDAASSNSFANSARQTPLASQNPTMAATLPRNHGSRTTSSVAAAAGDAAEAAAAANILPKSSSSTALPRTGIPDNRASVDSKTANAHDALAADSTFVETNEKSDENNGGNSVATSDNDEGEFHTQIPHVRSGLSDLAAAAMESADASLSSIEAHKARVKFSLADHVIEPAHELTPEEYAAQSALRISLRSDDTEPYSPDMTALTSAISTGYMQEGLENARFEDATSIVSGKSRSNTPQDEVAIERDSESEDATSMLPEVDTLVVKEEEGCFVSEHHVGEYVTTQKHAEHNGVLYANDTVSKKIFVEEEGHTGDNIFVPAEIVASPLRRSVLADGPGSGRENIVDEFEVFDEYVDSHDDAGNTIEAVDVLPDKNGVVSHSAAQLNTSDEVVPLASPIVVNGKSLLQNSSDENSHKVDVEEANGNENTRTNTVRNLIEKWAGLDSEKFGSVVPPVPNASENTTDANALDKMMTRYVEQAAAVAQANQEGGFASAVSEAPVDAVGDKVVARPDVDEESKADAADDEDQVVTKSEENELAQNVVFAEKTIGLDGDATKTSANESLVKETYAGIPLETKDAIENVKEPERKAKKVEFVETHIEESEKENDSSKSANPAEDAVVRKMSSKIYQTERPQGGWFVQNIFSRLSKQPMSTEKAAPATFFTRRSIDKCPNLLRVPVEGDPATDKGAIAIRKAREMSEKIGGNEGTPCPPVSDDARALQNDSATEDKPVVPSKMRSKNTLPPTATRSLPRETSTSPGEAEADDGRLSRKLSVFAGALKRSGENAPTVKARRYPFGRGPMRAGTTSDIAAQIEADAGRTTATVGRSNHRRDLTGGEPVVGPSVPMDTGEEDGTVRRKMSLAKIGDAFMSKLSVSYHEPHHRPAQAAQENRRSSLRFVRHHDSPDVRRANTNVEGQSRREGQNEGRNEPSGFGRRLWSRWAKMKA